MNLHAQLLAYKARGKLCCTSTNVIYLISCKQSKEQYTGSAFKDNFKPRFRVHKSDVITENIFLLNVLMVTNLKTLKFN